MKLKQKLAAAAIAAIAATTTTSVLADTGNTLPVADAFTTSEMASLFEQDAQPLQLAALSEQEMQTTEGAWFFWRLPSFIRFEPDRGDGFLPVKFDPIGRLYWRPGW